MEKEKRYWGIWAKRGAGSVLGPAQKWAKHNGDRLAFENKGEAEAIANHYNGIIRTANVSYSVKEIR